MWLLTSWFCCCSKKLTFRRFTDQYALMLTRSVLFWHCCKLPSVSVPSLPRTKCVLVVLSKRQTAVKVLYCLLLQVGVAGSYCDLLLQALPDAGCTATATLCGEISMSFFLCVIDNPANYYQESHIKANSPMTMG